MTAVRKANRVLRVSDAELPRYKAAGYEVYNPAAPEQAAELPTSDNAEPVLECPTGHTAAKSLRNMTKTELRIYASARDIKLPSNATQAQMVSIIEAELRT